MAKHQPPEEDVPAGAAVFPEIPAELGVDPLLLTTLHALIFLSGSDSSVLHPLVAEEALDHLAAYLQRLAGTQLHKVREDMDVLVRFARQEKWPAPDIEALQSLLEACGVGQPMDDNETEEDE